VSRNRNVIIKIPASEILEEPDISYEYVITVLDYNIHKSAYCGPLPDQEQFIKNPRKFLHVSLTRGP
jgi:hypothetical protein